MTVAAGDRGADRPAKSSSSRVGGDGVDVPVGVVHFVADAPAASGAAQGPLVLLEEVFGGVGWRFRYLILDLRLDFAAV
jgi:hypothetical protein